MTTWSGITRRGSRGHVEVDRGSLTVTAGGRARRFELADPDTRMTLHHWAGARGTVLRIASRAGMVQIGGEGHGAPDLAYDEATADRADVTLPASELAQLLDVLGAFARAEPASAAGTRFVLWPNRERPRHQLRATVGGLLLVAAVAALMNGLPLAAAIPLSVVIVACFGALEVRAGRRAREPSAHLAFEGSDLVLVYPGDVVPARTAVAALSPRTWRWRRVASRTGGGGTNDLPAVAITVAPGRELSIGTLGPFAAASGPMGAAPEHVVAAAWWPSLAERLRAPGA